MVSLLKFNNSTSPSIRILQPFSSLNLKQPSSNNVHELAQILESYFITLIITTGVGIWNCDRIFVMDDKEISDFLFLEDKEQSGDIAIAFGIKDWQNPLNKAMELYEKGSVNKILFTGGVNRVSGEQEAISMYEEAIKRGIQKEDLLLESGASNTLENVLFSKKVLEKTGELFKIKRICAVMANIHARRVLMTFKKHFPENLKS